MHTTRALLRLTQMQASGSGAGGMEASQYLRWNSTTARAASLPCMAHGLTVCGV
jgi:hypothetical protein